MLQKTHLWTPAFGLTLGLIVSLAYFGWSAAARAEKSKSGAADGPVLIGYVSVERAILETEEGKRAKAKLKGTFDTKQKNLNDREAELVRMKEALEKEAQGKDDAETRKKVADFQNKLIELRQVFMKERQELQEAEQKELSSITDKMKVIIEGLGKDGGYTMILEASQGRLLYAKPHLDLTNELIRKYNARHK